MKTNNKILILVGSVIGLGIVGFSTYLIVKNRNKNKDE